MSDSFLRAAQIRSSDSPSPPAAAELIASLGADELQVIALSVDDPAIVCRMAAVCRLWRATAHSEPVWAALAAAYWVGPLARPPTGSARDAVVGIESALRDVASGRRRLAILLEQNGEIHVPLASCRWTCALDASPFRILSVFGGSRPFCSVSLLSNASDVGASAVAEAAAVLERDKDEFLGLLEPVPYSEGKLGRPLLELHPGRVHEEEDFDEADAMMNWEAGGSPGPGLFLSCHTNHRDKGRHQSLQWFHPDGAKTVGPPGGRPVDVLPQFYEVGLPVPFGRAGPGGGLILCPFSVRCFKDQERWHTPTSSGHTPAMIAGWDNEPPWQDVGEWRQGGEPAGSICRSLFVVAVQQRVSVASSHFVTRQEELHREWFRVDFR